MKKLYFLSIIALAIPHYAKAPYHQDKVEMIPVMSGMEQTILEAHQELFDLCYSLIQEKPSVDELTQLIKEDTQCTMVTKLKALVQELKRVQETTMMQEKINVLERFLNVLRNITLLAQNNS